MPLPPLDPQDQYGGAHISSDFKLVNQEIPDFIPTTVPVDIVQGGTSATDAATARTNLGLDSAATKAIDDFLQAVNNLSDLVSSATARSNLGLGTAATVAVTSLLQAANNLSDIVSTSTARTNLGLGSSATHASTDFLAVINNLSDIANAATARLNLGLGSSSTHAATDFLQTINNLSDLISQTTARANLGLTIGTNVEAWSANLDTFAGKTPPTGAIVGTTDTQTLTNKNLTQPTISDFTNSNHNHTSVSTGGQLTDASLSSPISISKGGTGSTTAAGALVNLGAQSSDISANTSYTGGDISIGTSNDASFVDVDATNAKISITVTIPGTWQVVCAFATSISSVVSLSLSSSTAFQLTDGTTNTPAINPGNTLPLSLGLVTSSSVPQTLIGTFTWSSAGTKTVKLQKKNITSGNIGTRTVSANSNSPLAMSVYRISN